MGTATTAPDTIDVEAERTFLEERLKALKGMLRGVQREISSIEQRLINIATSPTKRRKAE
jgi:hypothetical protein